MCLKPFQLPAVQVAEQRAAEAEEEQVNSEQHLTGQIAELAALHHEQDTFTSSADQLLPSQLNTAATSSAAQQAQHAQQELQGLQSALNTSNASLASTQQQLSLARQQIRQLQHSDAEDATGTPQPQHVQHSITAEQQSLLQVTTHWSLTHLLHGHVTRYLLPLLLSVMARPTADLLFIGFVNCC